jgi:hypothetical protein
MFIDFGAATDIQDVQGWYPVHGASMSFVSQQHSDTSVLRYLVEDCHCDISVVDYDGDTPLHVAGQYGNRAAFDYLVSRGADTQATNSAGEKPQLS